MRGAAIPRRIVGRFLQERSGQFAMMTAIMTPVALMLAAAAVDVGALHLEKRQAQSLTDLAAITAAGNLDKPAAAALVAMADNGADGVVLGQARADGTPDFDAIAEGRQIVVFPGRYVGDAGVAASQRFTAGGTPTNAVRIAYRTIGTRYFAGAFMPAPEIVTWAVAGTSAEAAFSIGSRLAALDGGIVNALLGGLLGTTVSLSVMDYKALLDADVSLLGFLDALATDIDLTAATYDEVLDAKVTVGQVAKSLARLDGLSGTAKAAANSLAHSAGSMNSPTFKLSKLIDLGEIGGQVVQAGIQHVAADVGVLELLTASAGAAGGGRQVSLDLGAAVPGLLKLTLDLAIGEPPQHAPRFAIGAAGTLVRTAQTRLSLVAEIGGLGGLLGTKIRIPIYLELAFAEARLKNVSCPTGRPDTIKVTVEARPGVANLYLAEVDPAKIGDFANPAPRSPAKLVQMPLVKVAGEAQAEMADISHEKVVFSAADIAAGRVKQVETDDFVTSLTRSLFSSLSLDVDVAGLGLGLPSGLTGMLGQTIGAAAPAIDGVLGNLLTTLGLSLGQADIRVHGATCGRPVLVQ